MNGISYILDASSTSEIDLELVESIYKNSRKSILKSEFIIYSFDSPMHKDYNGLVFVNDSGRVSQLAKSVTVAKYDSIVFTKISNLSSDLLSHIEKIYDQASHNGVTVPRSKNTLTVANSIWTLKKIPYVIAAKKFIISHPEALASFDELISKANAGLELGIIDNYVVGFPDSIIENKIIIKPYHVVIKRRFQIEKQNVKDSFRRRKDLRLSRNVPKVDFEHDIPVFIICRDRVEPLLKLVRWCEEEGLTNIILIDNASTYPPLINFLRQTRHEVVWLSSNIGHTSPWDSGAVKLYANNRPFIVTDPDVIPLDGSHGAIKRFAELISKYPERRKVGFGLKIDDIPDHYELKENVVYWESKFWETSVETEVYDAEIDTTFALYRQNSPYILGPALRTGKPFLARHEPWYIDSNNISQEVQFYRKHANSVISTWGTNAKELNLTYSKNEGK